MSQPHALDEMIASAQRDLERLSVELEKTRRELGQMKELVKRSTTGAEDPAHARHLTEAVPSGGRRRRASPRRGFLKSVGVLAALAGGAAVAASAPVFADTPVLVAYQGRLTDTSGNPLNGTLAMQFALYAAASGGSPVWHEVDSVTVTGGLFNVLLGSNAQLPASLFAANSVLYLGITVGGDSEMTPRVLLGSAPYAALAAGVPNGSITDSEVAASAGIAESKIAFSGMGHGHTGGADGKQIGAKFAFFVPGGLSVANDLSWNPLVPAAQTVSTVSAYVKAAPTGAGVTVQVFNITQNKVVASATINAGELTATTSSVTNAALRANDALRVDVTGVGSATPGADLSVVLT